LPARARDPAAADRRPVIAGCAMRAGRRHRPRRRGGRWTGTLEAQTAATVPGNECSSTWAGKLSVRVRANGQVKGTGTADATAPPSCTLGIAGVAPATHADLTVTGIFTGSEFRLRFQAVAIEGFDGGFHLMYNPGPPRLRFPLVRDNLASGSFTLFNDGPEELAGGGGTAALGGILSLAKRKS
jgi:hypothetical protein